MLHNGYLINFWVPNENICLSRQKAEVFPAKVQGIINEQLSIAKNMQFFSSVAYHKIFVYANVCKPFQIC